MKLNESILKNLRESSELVDDKYIIKNIFNKKSLGNTVLDSYKETLNYMNTIDNIKPTLNTYIGTGIYLFTLDEINKYISNMIGSSSDYCKVRYNACRRLVKYVSSVKDLRNYLFKLFMDENITNNMTESQRISKYQKIIMNKYNNKLPGDHLGENALQKIAFGVWLSSYKD